MFDAIMKRFSFAQKGKTVEADQRATEDRMRLLELQGQVDAINRSQGVIEFTLEGTILWANNNFLNVVGYRLEEIKGRHHSMFVTPAYRESAQYRQFWEKLAGGEFDSGEYQRLGKNNWEVWLQASYNPVLGADGRPVKVVKFAADITQQKLQQLDFSGQITAIHRAQAVIEFSVDGTILTANEHFCAAVGYTLDEIKGQHHRLFVSKEERESNAYRQFWERLGRGEFDAGQYCRISKSGKEVWLQASYNPILGPDGKPRKVVKYATDITAQKLQQADFSGQLAAIDKAQAVIEFGLDGIVLTANDHFCNAVGYSLSEIKGQHHRIFVSREERESPEYQRFWERLGRGEFDAGQYRRVAKGGREVWLQASYNPILDPNGKPFKVVKYATDITEQKHGERELETVMNKTADAMRALSEGDLSKVLEGQYSQKFNVLQEAVNSSLQNLRSMVRQIREATTALTDSTAEISKGNQDLSNRTADQASSLEETASTMEELTSTVKQNAENAQQANRLAGEAREQAKNGGNVVTAAVEAMGEINSSAKKIADIIGVIDEIAFQTNLLALNAAVEAARAGEQGRGFAVVAGEVRNLAQRSAQAAKEIKGLIKDSVAKVEEGSRLVDKSGTTLKDIMSAVNNVSTIVGEIAAASAEQSTGIAQTNQAVNQMDRAVQQNAALVEEVAAVSNSMEDQSRKLAELVRFFKDEDSNAGGALNTAIREERRKSDRPWTGSKPKAPVTTTSVKSAAGAVSVPSRKVAAGGSDDSEWAEF